MSNIPYRAIPISLESNAEWLKLSLKRRELFIFMYRKAVSTESYLYKGKTLTFGQYVWSLNKLREKFNETLNPEDQYSRSGLQEALQHLYKIGFINKEKFGTTVHAETLVTVLYSDCYSLMKNNLRTAFDELRTTSVQPTESTSVQPHSIENTSHNTPTTAKEETEKTTSVQVEIPLNNELRTTNIDLTESTTKTVFRKDNVRTMPLLNENLTQDSVNAPPKYKLTAEQNISYSWLHSQKIDTSVDTLSWWAKNYDLKRLKDVYKAAVMVKPKKNKKNSIGALMNNFLRNEIPVEKDSKNENIAFMDGFMERIPEMNWKIEKKYITCEIKGIKKEVFLNLHSEAFVNQLIMLENQFKESRI